MKVSVILPVFNAEKFLGECLESILNQTLKDFEVIIVDDCSTDNSIVVAENFLERFGGRLKIISLPKNTGGGALPRNVGLDFARGNKVTGAGFPFYVGSVARLVRALIAFFLQSARENGYTELLPPLLVNAASATATGQLPDKEGQMYGTGDGFYCIPTAEVPVTNFFRDEIFEERDLPKKYCAYSACFRREAGSWGKDVRGLNRLHQFDKVELV